MFYGFDINGVNEMEVNVIFNDVFSFNQQGLFVIDGSWQSIFIFNMSLFDGYGNLWGLCQYSFIGNVFLMQQNDYVIIGVNVNLCKIVLFFGMLSVS